MLGPKQSVVHRRQMSSKQAKLGENQATISLENIRKIRKNPCLEPIICRFNIPIILLKTWQFVAHGNTESRKMLIETKYHLSDRPNNRQTLSTHLMIEPNLCGTTIFVSLFFFFTVLYHSSGKQREMKELTHAF